MIFHDSIIEEE